MSKSGSVPGLSLWRAAQVLAEDPKLVSEFEDEKDRTPRDRPASEGFTDAYQRASRRYHFSQAAVLADALAEVAGDDGVISGEEWNKFGTRFQRLALELSEKAKNAKPASGRHAEAIVGHSLPATRNAILKTSENLAGVNKMPVLAGLLQEVEAQKPLAGTRIFAVQHLFSSSFGLFEALERAGADIKSSHVFGKSYSTNQEVRAALELRGWNVQGSYDAAEVVDGSPSKISGIEFPFRHELGRALEEAAASRPPKKLLLLDEGGKLNRLLHDVFPQYAHLCKIVEQTTNGLQNMEGVALKAPAVSVADSKLKRDVEGPIIGEDVAKSTLSALDAIDPRLIEGKTVGIVGYGAVGSATAQAFARRGFKVFVTDIDPKAEQNARVGAKGVKGSGSIEVRPRSEVLGAGIVIGCTGRGCMSLEETKLVSAGAILVSAASGYHEFPQTFSRGAGLQGAVRAGSAAVTSSKDWGALEERAKRSLANPTRGTIVHGETPNEPQMPPMDEDGRISFPTSTGKSVTVSVVGNDRELSNLYLQQDDRSFVILRGGTPINMDRDLPPESIQLTRGMLFAACLQAMKEETVGWRTFDVKTQEKIETSWRRSNST